MTDAAQAIRELRRRRRARRPSKENAFDVFYRYYLAMFAFGYLAFVGYAERPPFSPATAAWATSNLAAAIGIAAAVVIAIGIRAGTRGGPVALDLGEIHHVLLAPVRRQTVLRPFALRQLLGMIVFGGIAGVVLGVVASRILPMNPVGAALSFGVTGVLLCATSFGAGLIVSGTRMRCLHASAMTLVLFAAAAAGGIGSSPVRWFGELALLPFVTSTTFALAAAHAAVPLIGLATIGGLSLERAARRAGLISQMRFAAALNDVRTVLLARRKLLGEYARRKPWTRVIIGHGPVWRRGWHSIARFPASRVLRILALTTIAGVATYTAWVGPFAAAIVAAACMVAIGLDLVEPVAQDEDHPDLRDSYPVGRVSLGLRQAAVPLAATAVLGTVACVIIPLAIASTATSPLPFASFALAGAAMAIGVATTATTGALFAVTEDRNPFANINRAMVPEAQMVSVVIRMSTPLLIALLGFVPILIVTKLPGGVVRSALLGSALAVVVSGSVMARIALGRSFFAVVKDLFARRNDESTADASDRPRDAVLTTRDLRKEFEEFEALRSVSVRVNIHEIVVLVGPNGAGKTTFLRTIAGLTDPSAGTVFVRDHSAGSIEARAAASFIPDTPVLYDDVSLREHAEFVARMHGFNDWQERFTMLVHRFNLEGREDDLPGAFSHGMRQKASLILGLNRPFELLLIDEPFVGLDIAAQQAVVEIVQEEAERGAAVMVATHNDDLFGVATRCIAFRDGHKQLDGPVPEDVASYMA